MIGFSPRRSLTAHHDWKEVLETLRAKFHTYVPVQLMRGLCLRSFSVKLPKSFIAINLSEKIPEFGARRANGNHSPARNSKDVEAADVLQSTKNDLAAPVVDGSDTETTLPA